MPCIDPGMEPFTPFPLLLVIGKLADRGGDSLAGFSGQTVAEMERDVLDDVPSIEMGKIPA